MEDSHLIKLSLIISLIGLFMLFIISDNILLEYSDINNIKKEDEGRIVRIRGVVKNVRNTDKVTAIDVLQEKMISVILFEDNNTAVSKGSVVDVEGEVRTYMGKPEIIADKIKVIPSIKKE